MTVTEVIVTPTDTIEAVQVISDYLSVDMTAKLLTHLKLAEEDVFPSKGPQSAHHKRKADWEVELEVIKLLWTPSCLNCYYS